MDVLPLNFRTLRLCGLWRERGERLGPLCTIYRLAVVVLVFYLTLGLSVETLGQRDLGHLTEALFLAMTYLTMCMKVVQLLTRRAELADLLAELSAGCCLARDPAERAILEARAALAGRLFLFLMGFVYADVGYFVIAFASRAIGGRAQLPYNTYQPYEVSSPARLYATAGLQFLAVLYSVAINISFDTMAAGLLVLIAGQLELNAHRLARLGSTDVDGIRRCLEHNVRIRGLVTKLESLVIGVVIPFMFFSLLSICSSMFQLSKYSIVSLDFIKLLSFALCILLQVLIYCWFGNEVMLKSEAVTNAIYNSDWTSMRPQYRKALHIMMICNKQGQTVSYGGQCSLNLNTFIWVLKMSYATVSLLHQVNA